MSEQMRCQQVTVPLPVALCEFVEREAEREDRSMASVIRRCVEAARQLRVGLSPGWSYSCNPYLCARLRAALARQ